MKKKVIPDSDKRDSRQMFNKAYQPNFQMFSIHLAYELISGHYGTIRKRKFMHLPAYDFE